MCQFKSPLNGEACTVPGPGFCRRHARTAQARKMKELEASANARKSKGVINIPPTIIKPKSQVALKNAASHLKTISEGFSDVAVSPKKKTSNSKVETQKVEPKAEQESKSKKVVIKEKPQPNLKKTDAKKSVIKSQPEKPETNKPEDTKRKLVLTKNKFGRYEDSETHIVFQNTTKRAYAMQNDDGSVSKLNANAYKICKERGWKCITPSSSEESEEQPKGKNKKAIESEDDSYSDDPVESEEESEVEESGSDDDDGGDVSSEDEDIIDSEEEEEDEDDEDDEEEDDEEEEEEDDEEEEEDDEEEDDE